MTVTVIPTRRKRTFSAPPSKSHAHRLLILSALSQPRKDGITVLCPEVNDDILATVSCLSAMGAKIGRTDAGFYVFPIPRDTRPAECTMNVRESGSTLRFLLPVLGALGIPARILRGGRLPSRPLAPLDALLVSRGMTISEDRDDPAVLCVGGKLTAGDYPIDGGVSSQFLSGLLMALPLLDGPSSLSVSGHTSSAPYVHMTLNALTLFGTEIRTASSGIYEISPSGSGYRPAADVLSVEGDWSGAANLLALGALTEGVTVRGLSPVSAQGDRRICDILTAMGCRVRLSHAEQSVSVFPPESGMLSPVTADTDDIPDLVPVIAVLCAAADGVSVLRGCRRLRYKESDRLSAILCLLSSVGRQADISRDDDVLTIRGIVPSAAPAAAPVSLPAVPDHRIVMASALTAWVTGTPAAVPCAEAAVKSFPGFFDALLA